MTVADAAVEAGARGVGLARSLLQPLQVRFGSGQRTRHLRAASGRGGRAGEPGVSLAARRSPESNVSRSELAGGTEIQPAATRTTATTPTLISPRATRGDAQRAGWAATGDPTSATTDRS